jgi:peptide-methionine (S)-S-oxide reductase
MMLRLILGVLMAGSLVSHVLAESPPELGYKPVAPTSATAILGGGCFWCLQHDLSKTPGVLETVSGYAGGSIPNPTYETYNKPAAGQKSHVEVVQVTYNPTKLSYEQLLHVYFQNVDPTDALGQFCDRGEEYRPIIVAGSAAERAAAEAKSAAVAKALKAPVFVEIMDAPVAFYPAEAYHQNYAAENQAKYQFYRWRCGRDAKIDALGLKKK